MRDALRRIINGPLGTIGFEMRRVIVPPSPFAWMQDLGIDTVIDIGANVGQFAEVARRTFPRATIHSFEPLPDCYRELQRRWRDDPLFTSANVALSDAEGEVEFHRSASSASSSLLPMGALHKSAFPQTARETVVKVPARRLDDAAAELSIGEHLLIKMDVQGAEDRVIRGGRQTIRRADVIVAEVSFFELYEGQALFPEVWKMLAGEGFRYAGSMGTLRSPADALNLSEDAVFLNGRVIPRLLGR